MNFGLVSEALFDERTKGKFVPKFRRPKKNKVATAPISDGCSSSASATTSLSMSSSCESLQDAGATALPSLPARPSFLVDPVAHKPATSLEDLAANYDSLALSPLSFMDEDMGDVYLPGYGLGDDGVKWPDPNECPMEPCDFSHLLPCNAMDADDKASPGSFCASTLVDEDEAAYDDMLHGLEQFLDKAQKNVEYISYADTWVPLDAPDSPNEASFVLKFYFLKTGLDELLYLAGMFFCPAMLAWWPTLHAGFDESSGHGTSF